MHMTCLLTQTKRVHTRADAVYLEPDNTALSSKVLHSPLSTEVPSFQHTLPHVTRAAMVIKRERTNNPRLSRVHHRRCLSCCSGGTAHAAPVLLCA